MRLKYIGESFGVVSLTNGKIYDAKIENDDFYRVIDDSGEDYLYSRTNPAPLDGSSIGGKWEIIDDNSDINNWEIAYIIATLQRIGIPTDDLDDWIYDENIDDIYNFLRGNPNLTLEQAEEILYIFDHESYNSTYEETKERIPKCLGKRVKVIIKTDIYGNQLGAFIIGKCVDYKKGKYNYDWVITVETENNSVTFMIPYIKELIRLKKDDHICPLVDGDVVSEIECCNMCLFIAGELNKRFIRKKYLKKENYIEICKNCKDHFTMEDLRK